VPAIGKPTFTLADNEMELGVGIHGEQGRERLALENATAIVERLAHAIDAELNPAEDQPVLLHVNGLGATPLVELYLIYNLAHRFWSQRGVRIARSLVGSYTTSLDMAGCSITLTLLDEEMLRLWDAPVHTAALRWGSPFQSRDEPEAGV
jgi:dihydroxyacetone kinase-like protein